MKLETTILSKSDCYIIYRLPYKGDNSIWHSNCYLIKSKDGAIAIDPGYDKDSIEAEAVFKNIKNGDIAMTHLHWEHWYRAFDLMKRGFSRMFVHGNDERYAKDLIKNIKDGNSNPESNKRVAQGISGLHGVDLKLEFDFLPFNYDELNDFEDKKDFEDKIVYFDKFEMPNKGIEIHCHHDGSHTKGHVTYQIDRVLFSGDLVVPSKDGRFRIESRLDHSEVDGRIVARDQKEIRKATKIAIRRIIDNKKSIDYIAPGHGDIIEIDEFVKKARRFLK